MEKSYTHASASTRFAMALLVLYVFAASCRDAESLSVESQIGVTTSICALSINEANIGPFSREQLAHLLSEICIAYPDLEVLPVDDALYPQQLALVLIGKDGTSTGSIVGNYFTGNYEFVSRGWIIATLPYIDDYSEHSTMLRAVDIIIEHSNFGGPAERYVMAKFGYSRASKFEPSINDQALDGRNFTTDYCRHYRDDGTRTSVVTGWETDRYGDHVFGGGDDGSAYSNCTKVFLPCHLINLTPKGGSGIGGYGGGGTSHPTITGLAFPSRNPANLGGSGTLDAYSRQMFIEALGNFGIVNSRFRDCAQNFTQNDFEWLLSVLSEASTLGANVQTLDGRSALEATKSAIATTSLGSCSDYSNTVSQKLKVEDFIVLSTSFKNNPKAKCTFDKLQNADHGTFCSTLAHYEGGFSDYDIYLYVGNTPPSITANG